MDVTPKFPNITQTHEPRRKRTRGQREYDLRVASELYLKGYTLPEIAEKVSENRPYSLSKSQIFYDLQDIRQTWIQSAILDFTTHQAQELAHIDNLEKSYWEAWEKSLQKQEITHVEKTEDKTGISQVPSYSRTKTRKEIKERDGNVTFLQGVQWCIEERCKILGLFAPTRINVNDWRKEAELAGVYNPNEIFNDVVSKFVSAIEAGETISLPRPPDTGNTGNTEEEQDEPIEYVEALESLRKNSTPQNPPVVEPDGEGRTGGSEADNE